MDLAVEVFVAFVAGLLAPLGAVCVLPLYPAFLAHLSGKISEGSSNRRVLLLGGTVVAGIMISMAASGLIITYLFRAPLSTITAPLSLVLYVILLVAGLLMLAGVSLPVPFIRGLRGDIHHSAVASFLFGLFFGLLVLPCNPGPLLLLFALSASLSDTAGNLLLFLVFGAGMAAPVFSLTILAASGGSGFSGFIGRYSKPIQRFTGGFLAVISLISLALFSR
jgi:cytochrome c-type biogenesis protein